MKKLNRRHLGLWKRRTVGFLPHIWKTTFRPVKKKEGSDCSFLMVYHIFGICIVFMLFAGFFKVRTSTTEQTERERERVWDKERDCVWKRERVWEEERVRMCVWERESEMLMLYKYLLRMINNVLNFVSRVWLTPGLSRRPQSWPIRTLACPVTSWTPPAPTTKERQGLHQSRAKRRLAIHTRFWFFNFG